MEFLTLNPLICVGWIIVGAIAGALARQVMGAKNQPFVSDVVLGLLGSIVGGFVAGLLGIARPEGGIDRVIINLVISIVGAIIVIYIGRLIRGRR